MMFCASSICLLQKNISGPVDAFYGPTHDCARSRDARRSSLQHLLRRAVRPVKGIGQTGRRGESAKSDERSPGRDPVGASACRVALGSAGQLGRPQTPWRREKIACRGWKSRVKRRDKRCVLDRFD